MELPLNWMCHAHKRCTNFSIQISLKNLTHSDSTSKGFIWKHGRFHVQLYSSLISTYVEVSPYINFVLIFCILSIKTFIWTHHTHYSSVRAITRVRRLTKILWQYSICIILCQREKWNRSFYHSHQNIKSKTKMFQIIFYVILSFQHKT